MSDAVTKHAHHVYAVIRSGASPEATGVTGRIARSWSRCANDYGLDPARHGELQQVSPAELAQRQARLDDLLAFAHPEMASLSQQIARSGCFIVLSDSDGVVLCYFGDPSLTGTATRSGFLPGAVWSERAQGTNAMGTCLAEQLPVVIHRDEHFLARNIGFTCSAAPVFDHQGHLIAALDASGALQAAKHHALLLVKISAQRIANRLFLHRFRGDFVLRFHRRPELVGTPGEGAIAFSASGTVLAVNRSALFQLGLRSPHEVVERNIGEIFTDGAERLINLPAPYALHPGPIFEARRGGQYFATTELPVGEHPRQTTPTPSRSAQRTSSVRARTPLDALGMGDPLMAENIWRAKRVLGVDIPVLLCGETGSGKEVFARALHQSGDRADKPFAVLSCASMPDVLLEAELFGSRAGGIDNAEQDDQPGKLLLANGGTLFLDEVGDMPARLQTRLLRVLEERTVLPCGGDAPVKLDIRLISATRCDLPAKIAAGEFRPDLYYRLQGLSLRLPPLRERGDRRELIRCILAEEAGARAQVEIDERAMDRLDGYSWPGNLRELRSVLKVALALREGHAIGEQDLPDAVLKAEPARLPAPAATETPSNLSPLESAERDALMRELDRHHWNITTVARRLKISRNTLYRKMQRLNIRDPNKKLLH